MRTFFKALGIGIIGLLMIVVAASLMMAIFYAVGAMIATFPVITMILTVLLASLGIGYAYVHDMGEI